MRRRGAFAAGAIVLLVAAAMTLNGIVDPKDEFYSGDALTAALDSHCLLGDDVVRARSYPEFKQDLYRRNGPTRISLGSNESRPASLNMSFPGFGPDALRDTMRFLDDATSAGQALRVRITTDADWFNTATHFASHSSALAYLLSPWTLASTLDLMRRSRTLAFTGWQKERAGETCVIDRGSPQPAWRADGTFTGAERPPRAWRSFAFHRLTAVDEALAIAERRGWRVVGISPTTGPPAYADQMKAIFDKHGYRWRIRRITV